MTSLCNDCCRIVAEETRWGELSLDTFSRHALLGVGAYSMARGHIEHGIGGHASWPDHLAEYGVLGFGWYLLLMVSVILDLAKRAVRAPHDRMSAGLLSICIAYVIAGSLNPAVLIIPAQAYVYFFLLSGRHRVSCLQQPLPRATGSAMPYHADGRIAILHSARGWEWGG